MACYLPEGEMKYLDFSKIEFDFYFGDNGAPIGKTSRYTIFDFNDFVEVSNFDYDLIYADMILFEDEENIVRSNRIVLEILKAYDICKNEELLKLAQKLCLFILDRVAKEIGAGTSNNFNAGDLVMYKINKYQIMKRLNVLSDNEIDDIEEMIQSGNLSTVAALACYTLLENQKASLRNFNKLSESEQEQFFEFPIGNLYKKITS